MLLSGKFVVFPLIYEQDCSLRSQIICSLIMNRMQLIYKSLTGGGM